MAVVDDISFLEICNFFFITFRNKNRLFFSLRESVAYPVLISAATPPTTARKTTGGWARMGGSKGCSKISRVSLLKDEKTSKKMAEGFRNVDIHPIPNRE